MKKTSFRVCHDEGKVKIVRNKTTKGRPNHKKQSHHCISSIDVQCFEASQIDRIMKLQVAMSEQRKTPHPIRYFAKMIISVPLKLGRVKY